MEVNQSVFTLQSILNNLCRHVFAYRSWEKFRKENHNYNHICYDTVTLNMYADDAVLFR